MFYRSLLLYPFWTSGQKKRQCSSFTFLFTALVWPLFAKIRPPPPTRFNTDIAIVNFFRTKQVFCGTYVAAYSVYLVIFHLSLFGLALFIFVSSDKADTIAGGQRCKEKRKINKDQQEIETKLKRVWRKLNTQTIFDRLPVPPRSGWSNGVKIWQVRDCQSKVYTLRVD